MKNVVKRQLMGFGNDVEKKNVIITYLHFGRAREILTGKKYVILKNILKAKKGIYVVESSLHDYDGYPYIINDINAYLVEHQNISEWRKELNEFEEKYQVKKKRKKLIKKI